ncbi:hybrid sensor histidine kinase/response regulator [Actinoplanes philippinensis]|uniref:hybrid sensor histidine kinase/response regulator n=1 Tax=Actinoplanes philippinensis TaxID=35752 RepID=UPI003407C87D
MATVLVVDDRATNREVARITLDDGGHQVIEATAGAEALELARRLHPDIVLADVVMPGMDGYEFVHRLRADTRTAGIPVLLYTANFRPDEAAPLAAAYGVTQVVSKSADPADLLVAIDHALHSDPATAAGGPGDAGAEHLRAVNAKLVEKALALDESEARFAALADVSPVGIVSGPHGLHATYTNPRLSDITGLTAAELQGPGWLRCLTGVDRDELITHGLPGGQAGYYGEIHLGPDQRRWLHTTIRRIDDAETAPGGFVATVDDVTSVVEAEQRRHAEERRRIAERFDGLARLSGAVAHDFNNMLNIVLSFTEFTADAVQDATGAPLTGDAAAAILADLDRISTAGKRAAYLAHQLLTFGGREVVALTVLDPNAVVAEVTALLGSPGPHITVDTDLQPGVRHVRADRAKLTQVLINLATNARDAMPDGGVLTFTSRDAGRDGYVHLTVHDTGHGMSPDVLDRAVEPFFSTKPKGHGTGLGLATAYGIVRQSGGELALESQSGHGTTVHLRLPATDEPVAHISAPVTGSAGTGHTVLVADDEDGVREAARRILSRAGYTVLTAADGRQALEIARHHPGRIDAVLSDVVMPHYNGPELAAALRGELPAVPVLYMSGYADPLMSEQGLLDPSVTVVGKPFTAEQLLTALHTVLTAVTS